MSRPKKNPKFPTALQITARVQDAVHRRLKERAKELRTKPGKLAAILLEAKVAPPNPVFTRQAFQCWCDEAARLTIRLMSCESLLRQWSCEGALGPNDQIRLKSLITQSHALGERAVVLEYMCQGVAAGLIPESRDLGPDVISNAQDAATKVLSARRRGVPVSRDQALLAEYLMAVGILKQED